MTFAERIKCLLLLGDHLDSDVNPSLTTVLKQAELANPWFSLINIQNAIAALCHQFLNEKALDYIKTKYSLDDNIRPKRVASILAGNIPLVGFHDILCTYICGHHAILKLSDKDSILTQYIIDALVAINPQNEAYFSIVQRLTEYDAVIATGSNSSAIHFEHYFSHVPHIIRKNRNSIAILDGNESDDDLKNLGKDIFDYFGLGCRNVSKIYLPQGFDPTTLMTKFDSFYPIIHHNKYKNNYDYAIALFLLNGETFLHNDFIILKEASSIPSRIATLHYAYYFDPKTLIDELNTQINEIQCIVSNINFEALPTVKLGQSQSPSIDTYADGVDTMQFLIGL